MSSDDDIDVTEDEYANLSDQFDFEAERKAIEAELKQFEEYGRLDEKYDPNCTTKYCTGFANALKQERCEVQLDPNDDNILSCDNHPECRRLYRKYKYVTCKRVKDCLPFDASNPIERNKSIEQLQSLLTETRTSIKAARKCIGDRLHYREVCVFPKARTSGHIETLWPTKQIERGCLRRAAAILRELTRRYAEGAALLQRQQEQKIRDDQRAQELKAAAIAAATLVKSQSTSSKSRASGKRSSQQKTKRMSGKNSKVPAASQQGIQSLADIDAALEELDKNASTATATNVHDSTIATDPAMVLIFQTMEDLFEQLRNKTKKFVDQMGDAAVVHDFYDCLFEFLWNMLFEAMEISTAELGETEQEVNVLQPMRVIAQPFINLISGRNRKQLKPKQYLAEFQQLLMKIHTKVYNPEAFWNRIGQLWTTGMRVTPSIKGRNVQITMETENTRDIPAILSDSMMQSRMSTATRSEQLQFDARVESIVNRPRDKRFIFTKEITRQRYRIE